MQTPNGRRIYRIFGLNIASDIPFPDEPEGEGAADVVVTAGQTPEEIPDAKISGVRFQASPEAFLLRVDDIANYYVTDGNAIVIERAPGATDQDILLFLMGSAIGALLHQRKLLPLHAGAVLANGGAVLFAGPSGVGKSTLAAGFQKKGYAVLADDVCVVSANGSESANVIPGFSRLKLWADALDKLETGKDGLKQVRQTPSFRKFFIPLENNCAETVPVRSMFVLETTNTDRFELEEIKGMARIEPIMAQTYRPRFLEGAGDAKAHFRECSCLANHARVLKLTRPQKGFRLEELMDLVEKHW